MKKIVAVLMALLIFSAVVGEVSARGYMWDGMWRNTDFGAYPYYTTYSYNPLTGWGNYYSSQYNTYGWAYTGRYNPWSW